MTVCDCKAAFAVIHSDNDSEQLGAAGRDLTENDKLRETQQQWVTCDHKLWAHFKPVRSVNLHNPDHNDPFDITRVIFSDWIQTQK